MDNEFVSNNETLLWGKNLSTFINNLELTQAEFADMLNIARSTMSNYCNGKKLPTTDFLFRLKKHFPDSSIDELLFGQILPKTTPIRVTAESSEIEKYYGIYSAYYMNTTQSRNDIQNERRNPSEYPLNYGLIYVYPSQEKTQPSEAKCLAVFSVAKYSSDLNKLRERIASHSESVTSTLTYIQTFFPSNLYTGTLALTNNNIFINLVNAPKDKANIILRKPLTKKQSYIGGLGTINSISAGYIADPIVQMIALSKNTCYLSEAEIIDRLSFASVKNDYSDVSSAITEILQYAKNLESLAFPKSPYDNVSLDDFKKYIPNFINDRIVDLIKDTIKSNTLYFGRVTDRYDDSWYHALTDSENYYNKQNRRKYNPS